jgi:hypothetical protein
LIIWSWLVVVVEMALIIYGLLAGVVALEVSVLAQPHPLRQALNT